MDQDFATGGLQSVRDYHLKTQGDGTDIIKKNVEVLEGLFELALRLKKDA
jgi:hypothetical protein